MQFHKIAAKNMGLAVAKVGSMVDSNMAADKVVDMAVDRVVHMAPDKVAAPNLDTRLVQ